MVSKRLPSPFPRGNSFVRTYDTPSLLGASKHAYKAPCFDERHEKVGAVLLSRAFPVYSIPSNKIVSRVDRSSRLCALAEAPARITRGRRQIMPQFFLFRVLAYSWLFGMYRRIGSFFFFFSVKAHVCSVFFSLFPCAHLVFVRRVLLFFCGMLSRPFASPASVLASPVFSPRLVRFTAFGVYRVQERHRRGRRCHRRQQGRRPTRKVSTLIPPQPTPTKPNETQPYPT